MTLKTAASLVRSAGLVLAWIVSNGAAPEDAATPVLEPPLACLAGSGCLIQQYADHDPGPGASDYRCGPRSYDGHDGTDFRLPDMAMQRKGIDVLAAAAGVVRSGRDGMADVSVRTIGKAAVAGRECGNGVVIDHPGGWQTQYCHMARGSIVVRAGQRVTVGQALGRVGLSGDTEFPHVHLSVRQGSRKVDPFADGAPAGACGAGRSLWSAAAARTLAYRRSALVGQGFSGAVLTMAEAADGGAIVPLDKASPALVYYVRLAGIRAGDTLDLAITAPDGTQLAGSSTPIATDKAEYFGFVGKRLRGSRWAPGTYAARYALRHEAERIVAGTLAANLPD